MELIDIFSEEVYYSTQMSKENLAKKSISASQPTDKLGVVADALKKASQVDHVRLVEPRPEIDVPDLRIGIREVRAAKWIGKWPPKFD